ncbi:hypothetical protein JNUCC1_02792 [Lentibacillus sp. JNUCC-1]|uniref:hypothetical protein n=1 Tax=Lentibacillus sp. JNUCC-1 TaxID=2654513 RepID=UPI0012E9507D|nr:hypothetical protein [Lentibacillus sp. JNUCC-1]MUV38920.1 hypothetical protein [Lentibacillus sp. JNUCC-1]
MKAFIDVLIQYGDLIFLGGIVVILLSIFIKKKSRLIVVLLILVVGSIFLIPQALHTTFPDGVSDQLNEDSTVQAIIITINDVSGDRPVREEQVTIRDKDIIGHILEDLSDVELKEDRNAVVLGRKYHLNIRITNKVEDGYYKTSTLMVDVDQHYLNKYKIVNEPNHLETIESLVENDEVDWEDLSE